MSLFIVHLNFFFLVSGERELVLGASFRCPRRDGRRHHLPAAGVAHALLLRAARLIGDHGTLGNC